jgi:hypothetical protein
LLRAPGQAETTRLLGDEHRFRVDEGNAPRVHETGRDLRHFDSLTRLRAHFRGQSRGRWRRLTALCDRGGG